MARWIAHALACALVASAWLLCDAASIAIHVRQQQPQHTRVQIINIYPHNVSAFTEGLFIYQDSLFESTGLNGQSIIREYALPDASHDMHAPVRVRNEFTFKADFFGEGIAVIDDILYALTYKAKEILLLTRDTFEQVGQRSIKTTTGEGWGMTTDGQMLIISDGSDTIQFIDPNNDFGVERTIQVTRNGLPLNNINELEYVEGEILANVWFKNEMLRIDPSNGRVIETIDFSWLPGMVSNLQNTKEVMAMRSDAVMNGIAYNPRNRHVYVTGKLWDSLFELDFSYLASQHHKHTADDQSADPVNV